MSEKPDDYSSDIIVEQYYNKIVENRVKCGQLLNQLQAIQHTNNSEDLQNQIKNTQKLKTQFFYQLNQYYDAIEYKFDKKKKIEKPEKVKQLEEQQEIFSVYDLEVEEAIKLYKKCNQLLEELEITSAEKLKRKDAGFGYKGDNQ